MKKKNKNRKYQQRFKDTKNQVEIIELKNAITKIKNSVEGLYSRVEMTENPIREVEDRSIEFTQSAQQKENRLKTVQY